MLSGAFAAIGAMSYSFVAKGFGYYTPQVLLMTLVTQIISGMILGGCLAKVVVDALSKTGVLNQYAIMKEKRNKGEQHEFISRVQ
ncbi:ABC transporter ATP-binding protein [Bacillus safensis FO-36b] [Bacillus safensis subsp. safensis]